MTKEILELINQKKYEEAIKLCDECLLNDNNNNITFLFFHKAQCYYDLALSKQNNKYYIECIRNYSILLDLIPDRYESKEAYFNRGLLYIHFGLKINDKNYFQLAIDDFDENIKLLKKYEKRIIEEYGNIELKSKYGRYYANIGIAYANLQNYKKAEENISKAIEINPGYYHNYHNRFFIYYYLAKNNYDYYYNALNDITKLIKLFPNNYKYLYSKGLILFYLKDYKKSISYYKDAIKLIDIYDEKLSIYTEMIESLYFDNDIDGIKKLYDKLSKIYYYFLEKYNISTNKSLLFLISITMKLEIELDYRIVDNIIRIDFDKKEYYKITNNSLYNYTIVNKNTLRSILNSQLWLSNTKIFNDPIDPSIKKNNYNQHYNYLLDKMKVGCLTTHNDNTLMWSHYADKHQGICIEYDINNIYDKKEIICKKIKYHIKMNKLRSFTTDDNSTIKNFTLDESEEINSIIDLFTIKSKEWEYEDEYRILFYDKENKNPNGALINLPIKSVCFGVQTSKEDKELIYNIVKSINEKRLDYNNNIIKLYQAELDDNELFKINIKPYEHNKNN